MKKLEFQETWGDAEETVYYRHFIILTESDEVVARGILYWDDAKSYGVMKELYVQDKFRGQGYGTQLQELRENYAKKILDLNSIWLWVDKDSWMSGWYKKRGFKFENNEALNEEIDLYENDRWMIKEL